MRALNIHTHSTHNEIDALCFLLWCSFKALMRFVFCVFVCWLDVGSECYSVSMTWPQAPAILETNCTVCMCVSAKRTSYTPIILQPNSPIFSYLTVAPLHSN